MGVNLKHTLCYILFCFLKEGNSKNGFGRRVRLLLSLTVLCTQHPQEHSWTVIRVSPGVDDPTPVSEDQLRSRIEQQSQLIAILKQRADANLIQVLSSREWQTHFNFNLIL